VQDQEMHQSLHKYTLLVFNKWSLKITSLCVHVDLISASAPSKRFIQQVIPYWHHYHHHYRPDKITSHSENSLILKDDGNLTKEFFEIFYPIDEETKADASYVQLHGPWSIQHIIDHRNAGICFVFQNQVQLKIQKYWQIEKKEHENNR